MTRRFRGESVHKVDQKGRVSVPAPFRRALEEGDPDCPAGGNPSFVLIYGIPGGHCLEGYTIAGANSLDEKVARLPSFSRARRALERLINTQSIYAQVDENGRIVLPQRLREMFGLHEEAVFAGMGEHFQIWSPGEYRKDMDALDAWREGLAEGEDPFAELDALDLEGQAMMLAPFARHVPVLLGPVLAAVAPVSGTWIDGTLGAGGYARGLLDAGADRVIGIDRDPRALAAARGWADLFAGRLDLVEGRFGELDRIAAAAGAPAVEGVVLDIGVSSMQLDEAERGFSFLRDGPLDMRMEGAGPSAADLVNRLPEAALADVLFQYGEERAARRIARAIAADRKARPFATTRELAGLIERLMPRPKPGQPHAATRSFQALRIAVNDELGELARGLAAAEAVLAPGGWLAVVTFHSLEDRVVKRFLQLRSGGAPRASRYAPEAATSTPGFALATRKAIAPDEAEVAANPRARSAKLRVARRLAAPAVPLDPAALGLPPLALEALT